MENFEISITDTRTGEVTKLTANDLVLHLGRDNGDNQLVAMSCAEFVDILDNERMLGVEAIDKIYTSYFREIYENFENQSLAQVVEMKDIPRKRDA
ncbi:hypothetical protein [Bacillus wiedmannii]|uniref:hypothetical protein n=1 Tax=Bacillus wiedmannii TaxID=1890302 RepID=UPI003D21D1F3